MVQILTIDEPTDLYLVGAYIDDEVITDEIEGRRHGITDDEHSINVVFGNTIKLLDTYGFFMFLTKEEIEKFHKNGNIEDNSADLFVFKNFVGTISLKVTTEYNDEEVDILEEYDPNEYLMYQEKMRDTLAQLGDGSMDYFIVLDGEGTFEQKQIISNFII